MTFRDIFKSGFLARTAQLSVADMAVSMLLAFAIGLFIFYIYKKSYRGVMYSANFGTSLIAVALVTTFVMLAVTSNVVLSLGMVGALSIVRFRTAVKDPMDIAFLFWSLAAGIVLASGLVHLALLLEVLQQEISGGEWEYALVLDSEFSLNATVANPSSSVCWRFAATGSALCFAVEVRDEDVVSESGRWGDATLMYEGDCIEFFVRPDRRTDIYFEFIVNPNGELWSLKHQVNPKGW